jgi:hypothetical protein
MTPSNNDPEQRVGVVLEALRTAIRSRRASYGHDPADPLLRELQQALDEVELSRVVSAHWPLTGQTLPQKLIAFVQKVVRRLLRWYINPIVEQQNAYNDTVARTLRLFAEAYTDLRQQLDDLTPTDIPPPISADPPRSTASSAVQPARLPDLELRALEPQLRLRHTVHAHWPLTERSLLERLIALVHKVQRFGLRWLMNPMVEQQNQANAAMYAALLALMRLDAERRAEIAAMRARRHT